MNCDAREKRLGEMLQQTQDEDWETTYFASQLLFEFELNYSTKDLERLTTVWAIEKFWNFVYGTEFEVDLDHKAW